MINHTKTPWKHVQIVNSDGGNLTPEEVGEYVAKTFSNGTRGEFHAIQATKEDGKVYDVCHVGNGPDSPWNAATIAEAVNYHGRLVEMVRDLDILFCLRHGCFPIDRVTPEQQQYNDIMTKARNLLAELEENK